MPGPEARTARLRYDRSVYDHTVPRPPLRGRFHCFRNGSPPEPLHII